MLHIRYRPGGVGRKDVSILYVCFCSWSAICKYSESTFWLFRSLCCSVSGWFEQIRRQDYMKGSPLMSDYWWNIYKATSSGPRSIIQAHGCVCVDSSATEDGGGKGLSRFRGTANRLLHLYKQGSLVYSKSIHTHTHANIHLLGDGWMSAAQGSCYIKINNRMARL